MPRGRKKRAATPGTLKFGLRIVGCNNESLKRWSDGGARGHVQNIIFSPT